MKPIGIVERFRAGSVGAEAQLRLHVDVASVAMLRLPPSKWKVVVNATRSPDYEEFNMSVTTFIARVLRGDLRPEHFPEDLWPAKPTAIAMRDQ